MARGLGSGRPGPQSSLCFGKRLHAVETRAGGSNWAAKHLAAAMKRVHRHVAGTAAGWAITPDRPQPLIERTHYLFGLIDAKLSQNLLRNILRAARKSVSQRISL